MSFFITLNQVRFFLSCESLLRNSHIEADVEDVGSRDIWIMA